LWTAGESSTKFCVPTPRKRAGNSTFCQRFVLSEISLIDDEMWKRANTENRKITMNFFENLYKIKNLPKGKLSKTSGFFQ
jgi:hypothetical protein